MLCRFWLVILCKLWLELLYRFQLTLLWSGPVYGCVCGLTSLATLLQAIPGLPAESWASTALRAPGSFRFEIRLWHQPDVPCS